LALSPFTELFRFGIEELRIVFLCRVLSCARYRDVSRLERSAPARGLLGAALLLAGCLLTSCGSSSPPRLAVTTSSLPTGVVGMAYSASLAASGGTATYSWSLSSGALPAGLTLGASTGSISGTPTAAGKTQLSFTVTDSSSPAQTQSVSLMLTIAPVLAVTTSSLPGGITGTAYSATLAASGGTPGYTWSVTSGTLPAGLTLAPSTGAITGSPTAAGSTSLTFLVADSGSPAQSQSVSLTLAVLPALVVTTSSLPTGVVGMPYSASLAASGGTGSYTWALTNGTLPAGIVFNPSTVVLSGTPAGMGSASLTFTVTDSGDPPQTKSVSLVLAVASALSVAPATLPGGVVGTAYSSTLAASGGTTPYTWSVTSGALVAGLSLAPSTGAITGTPTAAGTPQLTFTVTDSGKPAQTQSINATLTVAPTLAVTSSSLPGGVAGIAYNASLAATGGTGAYTWSLTGGTLPAGLTLNAATGALTGTTAATGNSSLTFSVSDSGNPVQTKSVSLVLAVAPVLAVTTSSLPGGVVGTAYSASLAASGGTTPYAWSVSGGALPAGISLAPATGAITGTPTAAGAPQLTFTVTDSAKPAQTQSLSATLTVAPTLVVTTASLPGGVAGIAYNATLAATGGTGAYTWSLTGGTLPTGITLNPGTGALTGTTATTGSTSLTFSVSDAGNPVQTKAVSLALSVAQLSLSLAPGPATAVSNQNIAVTATTNDPAGIAWTASGANCSGAACGTFSDATSLSGKADTYIAPATGGIYTVTATNASTETATASFNVAVTGLAGVTTYHNGLYRDGVNSEEYALTPASVNSKSFGKLFSCAVDGAIYAQPLWVPGLSIGAVKRNVVFVATQHDSLFAFDADPNSNPCTPLWQASLIDQAHGGDGSESPVPSGPTNFLVGKGGGDITPEVGITGTPVIDLSTNTLYVVSKSVDFSGPIFYQRLHAIDLLTGNEKFSGPATIYGTYPGSGDGGLMTTFVAQQQNQRPGLALANGVVYISWASHEDKLPYYGWVMGYKAADLTQASVLNLTPDVMAGGIWMAGGAPGIDSSGNLFLLTGNALFDANQMSAPNNDYGDSLLELSTTLNVEQYFTPSDEASDAALDADFGAGGVTLIDVPANGSKPTHLVVGGGKDAILSVLNRDDLGGLSNRYVVQRFSLGHGIYATGAYWNSTYFIAGSGSFLSAYSLNPATAQLNETPASMSASKFHFPGTTPSVSSQADNSNGIVWALDNSQYCTPSAPGCGPAVLHAYDATNLATELWNSSQGAGNAAGNAVKFTVPTIANGKVYVGTRGNNSGGATNSSSVPGELEIYGLSSN
jgi:hypothetical protein